MPEPPTDRVPPFVSVVMPVRDEALHLAATLASVLAQDHPADRMEILVVDGGSSDATRQIAARAAEGALCPVRVLDNPGRSAAAGMNAGIAAAVGQVIVRVDGHVRLPPSYVRESVAALFASGADCAGGGIRTVGSGLVGRALALAMSSPFGVGSSAFRTGADRQADVDTVPFGAYRREVFDRLGGFDERFTRNQDDEFHLRLVRSGGRIVLAPRVRSTYACRDSFAAAWRQFFGYGFWKVAVLRKHGTLPSGRGLVPPAFVAVLVVAAALATVEPLVPLAVVAPYVIANLLASLAIGLRRDAAATVLLPVAYAVLHVAYGVGFWAGLVAGPRLEGRSETPAAPVTERSGVDARSVHRARAGRMPRLSSSVTPPSRGRPPGTTCDPPGHVRHPRGFPAAPPEEAR